MEEPKVSIIVPVYKAEDTISCCIESILGQTYRNIELILVEDGSPGKSGAICDKYSSDSRVTVIHNTNHGVSYTRNIGVKHATGKYITFCDADDYYVPDHVEKNVFTALKQDSDITISGYYIEQGEEFVSSVHIPSGQMSEIDVVRHFTVDDEFGGFCWNKFYKREVLQGIKFPEDLAILEDTYLLCSAMENSKKIYYLAEPLYYYCDSQSSVTRNVNMLYSEYDTVKYIDSYRKILVDHHLSQKSVNIIHGRMFEMSVDFRRLEYQGLRYGGPKLIKNLEVDIKHFCNDYYCCDEFPLKRKLKYTIKMLLPKLHC